MFNPEWGEKPVLGEWEEKPVLGEWEEKPVLGEWEEKAVLGEWSDIIAGARSNKQRNIGNNQKEESFKERMEHIQRFRSERKIPHQERTPKEQDYIGS